MMKNLKCKTQVFLILTDKFSDSVIDFYQEIGEASNAYDGDTFVLYHRKESALPERINTLKYFAFDNSILSKEYTPITNSLIPGSNHFPLFEFYLKYPNYEYYWVIEDDVKFSGNWKSILDFFYSIPCDFISCHIRPYNEEPDWYWWKALFHPEHFIPIVNRIRSFNPIYRIKNLAINFIQNSLKSGWRGHHEVLFPTLLNCGGYKIADFGGDSKFNIQDCNKRFYTNETMNWRPILYEVGDEKDKLYHPIKPKPPIIN